VPKRINGKAMSGFITTSQTGPPSRPPLQLAWAIRTGSGSPRTPRVALSRVQYPNTSNVPLLAVFDGNSGAEAARRGCYESTLVPVDARFRILRRLVRSAHN